LRRTATAGPLHHAPHPKPQSVNSGDELNSVRHLLDLGYEDRLDVAARERALRQRHADASRHAERLLSSGQIPDAVTALEALVREVPDWAQPHRLLAHAYSAAGQLDLASEQLDWLTFHGCETPQLALLRGGLAMARRRFDEASDLADYARRLDAGIAGADAMLGQLHVRRGLTDDAERAFQRELAHHPASAAALAGLAAVWLRRDDCERAVDWALRALEQNIRQPATHYRLGVALARLGRTNEAVTALETAAKLRPDFAAPFRLLTRLAREPLHDLLRAAEYERQGRERLRRRRRGSMRAPVHR
jgi:tetratricopeptide (TPR) repeat protein